MPIPQTPDWVRDAIFYQIYPDRFAKSLSLAKPSGLDAWGSAPTPHGYQGGDLVGVVERLDYLAEPRRQRDLLHADLPVGVEPPLPHARLLPGRPDARRRRRPQRLIDEAHARNIRVVLDGVFNHASRGFFQFHDILENGQNSAYLDWFTVHGWPINAYNHEATPGYSAWWGLHALPKFNTDTPAVREFLWDVGRYWIDFGADGWRLDVAHEVDDRSFWAEFRRSVHRANPDAYIVGEVWEVGPFDSLTDFDQEIDRPDEATRWLRGDCWDAVMNYLFTRVCYAFFIGDNVDVGEMARTSFRAIDETGAVAFRATSRSSSRTTTRTRPP